MCLFVAMPGILFSQSAKPTVTLLTWSHFVAGYNEELKSEVAAWAAQKGVNARVDFLSLPDLTTRLTAEVESQQGHDVVVVWNFSPALYKENLLNLDDVATNLERQYGPWADGGKYLCQIDGHWKALPWTNQALLANINTKYWAQAGYTPSQVANLTWDKLLDAAKKLQAIGHPVGFALNATFDANGGLYPIIWSFGGNVIDSKGNIVLDSPQMRAAMEYVKKLAQFMPAEVYGWDDAGNNKFILSGVGSWTPNPPSIRPAAIKSQLPVTDEIDHVSMPSGVNGSYRVADFINLGIWKFSKNIDLSKDLVSYLLSQDSMKKQVMASQGYNVPSLTGYPLLANWWKENSDLRLGYYNPSPDQVRPSGWPAPPGKTIQIVYNLNIIPQMFAKYAKGDATLDNAIAWGIQQIQQVTH
jgi:multiple sugar transport system substrate-binding protein